MARAVGLLILVVVAGCGGTGKHAPATSRPQTVVRNVEATAPQPTPQPQAAPAREAEPSPPPSPPTSLAVPAPSAPPAPPPGSPWRDCGRILSPVDRRPLRVEAEVFDCPAARRVAMRYLRKGGLPYGWKPTDCAASRAACEQGGWGFKVVAG